MLGIIIMWAILLAIAELGVGPIKTAVGELETNSTTNTRARVPIDSRSPSGAWLKGNCAL
jgi:hypothetical protein